MTVCSYCQAQQPATAQFCNRCGTPLAFSTAPYYSNSGTARYYQYGYGYFYAAVPPDVIQQAATLLSQIWNRTTVEEKIAIAQLITLALKGSYEAIQKMRQWIADRERLREVRGMYR